MSDGNDHQHTTMPAPTSEADDAVAQAIRYSRTREVLFLIDLVAGWLLQVVLIGSGGAARLARASSAVTGERRWLADGLFAISYGLMTALASLPLAYARGYIVEQRFGLSTQSRRAWLGEQAKATALGLALEAPLTAASFFVIRRSPRSWWFILSALALPVTVLLAQLYPVAIAPLFNRFTPLRDPALAERVRALAARAGVRIADVVEMDMSRQTRKANAFFAGLGPTRRIALGDTLVEQFTPDEVEVIVAHELGHQVHHDIWKGIGLATIGTFGGALAVSRLIDPLLRRHGARLGIPDLTSVAAAPVLSLLASMLSVLAMPLANAVSRALMERPADRYALDLTGQPTAYISALEKLAHANLLDPDPPRLVTWLLHSHPPVRDRIAMARAVMTMASGHPDR